MTVKIVGTGRSVPARVVTNEDLAEIVDTSDEWIRTRTGIRERRIAEAGSGTSALACQAAQKALGNAGIKPEELDIIVVATSSADCYFPSTACQVQAAIGAENAIAFDLGAACTGFIYALHTVYSFFQAGVYKTGLVIGAETMSKIVDWSDRRTCVLFGDGAGAVVVRAEENGSFHMTMGSDGTRGKVLKCQSRPVSNFLTDTEQDRDYVAMDGQEVFKFAVKTVPEAILKVLQESGTPMEEVRYFLLHQANSRIFESIAKRLNISMDKIPANLDRYGNTSAATIPMLLDELSRDGKLNRGDKLVLAGFGGGLTWGATLFEW